MRRRFAGITVQALAASSCCIEYVPAGNIAVLSRDGASMALISTSSGNSVQHALSSDLITNSREAAAALLSQTGVTPIVIVAIGGDQRQNVLALINGKNQSMADLSLVQLDSAANVSYLGSLQLPLRSQGVPVLPSKLVCIGSDVAIVSRAGITASYPRPPA